ncbi:MAG: YegP family protein [Salinibacter sp.]
MAASKATFVVRTNSADEFYWVLEHQNGNTIADSGEGYENKADALNGIQSVKENAPGAPIVDETGK